MWDGAEALDFIFAAGGHAHCKVGGLEVLRRVKSDPRTRLIPVVALTSSRGERDIVESYQLGVNCYITKPVDFDQFVEAVR